jgi:hypothetical protein
MMDKVKKIRNPECYRLSSELSGISPVTIFVFDLEIEHDFPGRQYPRTGLNGTNTQASKM